MATTNQQVVYAMATPPHGVVQYEYYTQQVPYASAPVQYATGAPPPPPPAADQSGEAAAKRSSEEGDVYPQRPGEKMCAYYMTTRTCSFGETCRYDHPTWVPIGGIPNWKEVTAVATPIESLPQRPTEPDCAYFMKTGECKYGSKCRFNHPKEKLDSSVMDEQSIDANQVVASLLPVKAASAFNSRGLPLRPGEGNCVFYGKTGSCKYGIACRYNHPEILLSGGRSGATLQPQQAVYVQSPQQPNVQYQMVQATQDYAYPATTTYQSTTPAYSAAATAYPVATAYTTATPTYAATPTTPYAGQQVITEYVYPSGATMQVYPSGTTTQAYAQGTTAQSFPTGTASQAFSQAQSYPPGTPTQGYPQGTIVQQYNPQGTTTQVFSQGQTYPPGTNSQTYPPGTTIAQTQGQTYPPGTPTQNQGAQPNQNYPPGTTAPQTVEYTYVSGQQAQGQQEYVYATQQASQNGTEYVYSTEQPSQQGGSEQYATAYTIDASGQPTASTEYGYTAAQNPQEYAYAAAQAYHQPVYSISLPHPQRPGEPDCTFYIKTGECSFGATCKFHHPPDRIPTGIPKPVKNQTAVKLSLAGLPRRETEAPCAYYMKTGACKFGPTCKYDHPPPQEIIAKAVEAARGEVPGSYDVNLPEGIAASMAAESQDVTPLPPGTDAPAVTAATM
ncbi:hypothetical protein M758_9G026700 [Ceratodon purpureus]|nr:hypothetical protein M758_9G026700 [Ceratodon purpureus]